MKTEDELKNELRKELARALYLVDITEDDFNFALDTLTRFIEHCSTQSVIEERRRIHNNMKKILTFDNENDNADFILDCINPPT